MNFTSQELNIKDLQIYKLYSIVQYYNIYREILDSSEENKSFNISRHTIEQET